MPGPALSPLEREEIRAFLVDDPIVAFASIAVTLGRDASTISREVGRNGGRERYRAVGAQQRADEESKRPRRSLLIADPVLACLVRADLDEGFSPAACAARLRRSGAGAICHETIYRSVFDGSLGLKPSECLRTRRPRRRRRRSKAQTTHVLGTFTKIADRPATVEDRVEAGHWEGDLIIGAKNASAVVTLVERTSRFTLLGDMPCGYRPDDTLACLSELFDTVPQNLRGSLTWDRGSEMAGWSQLESYFDMPVYFADAHSPWQRGSNENQNRQVRFWLPKGSRLDDVTPEELASITNVLNHQPRRMFGWETSAERYAAAACTDR
jgi:IS30 family transposase